MTGSDIALLIKGASDSKARKPQKPLHGLAWSSLAGITAMLIGVCVVLTAHLMDFDHNNLLNNTFEIAGLGIASGGVAYIYGRLLKRTNAGLENETRERRRAEGILRLQRDLAIMIGSANNVQSALERILDIGFLIEGVDCGGIYLVDDETGGLRLMAHRGLSEQFVASKTIYAANDPHTLMVKTGKPILCDYKRLQTLFNDNLPENEGLKALAIVPMLSENRITACLNLASRTSERFSEGIADVFQVAASLLTGAIERLRGEEALRQSEDRFRIMADFTLDLEYWIGVDGNMMYVSPSCEQITGYTRAEFQANPNLPDLIVHPDDRSFLAAHRVGRPDRPKCEAEYRILTRSGNVRWIAHVCVPVTNPDGKFLGRRASDRDVTARHLAEQALRQERVIFTSGPIVVFKRRNDKDMPVEYVSPNVTQFGYKPEDFYERGLTSLDIIHFSDRERVISENKLYIQAGLADYEQEYRVVLPNGETRWVHDVTRTAKNELGAITHIHGYLLDITERKLAEEKLKESERNFRALALENAKLLDQAMQDAQTKSTLLQEVNHRVKNNLSSIIGLLRTEERFSMLEPARNSAARFHDMAERVSGLATVHTLLSAAEWGPIPLDKLVRHVFFSAMRLAPSDKHTRIEVETSNVQVSAKEANGLALIFNELAMNTIKYGMKDRNGLFVSAAIRTDNNAVTMEFRNNGEDFPQKVLAGELRGMGLYLMETLVKHDLNGSLSLRNENGPVVVLTWPKTPAPA